MFAGEPVFSLYLRHLRTIAGGHWHLPASAVNMIGGNNMRLRFSILNLLLVTTILALVIIIVRLNGELSEERSLRLQQLRHGGILQISDPDAIHLVQLSTRGELNTLRWR